MTDLSREHGIKCAYLKTGIPVAFYSTKAGSGVAVLGMALGVTYNTNRLDANQRAIEAFRSAVLPGLEKLTERFADSEFQHVGAIVFYSSKDFLREGDWPAAEMLSVSSSTASMRQFMAGEITEHELMATLEAYSVNGNIAGPRRISLK